MPDPRHRPSHTLRQVSLPHRRPRAVWQRPRSLQQIFPAQDRVAAGRPQQGRQPRRRLQRWSAPASSDLPAALSACPRSAAVPATHAATIAMTTAPARENAMAKNRLMCLTLSTFDQSRTYGRRRFHICRPLLIHFRMCPMLARPGFHNRQNDRVRCYKWMFPLWAEWSRGTSRKRRILMLNRTENRVLPSPGR